MTTWLTVLPISLAIVVQWVVAHRLQKETSKPREASEVLTSNA